MQSFRAMKFPRAVLVSGVVVVVVVGLERVSVVSAGRDDQQGHPATHANPNAGERERERVVRRQC